MINGITKQNLTINLCNNLTFNRLVDMVDLNRDKEFNSIKLKLKEKIHKNAFIFERDTFTKVSTD